MSLIISKLELNSAIFNDAKLLQCASNYNTRCAKKLKTKAKNKQILSSPSGRVYARATGPGFRRAHRASARFEYPSPDTMNLVNSMKDAKTSALRHVVYQDDDQAHYGKYLIGERFERKILPENDVKEFVNTEQKVELKRFAKEIR